MRWLDSIIDSVDMNLGKLREIERNREAWVKSALFEPIQSVLQIYSDICLLCHIPVEFCKVQDQGDLLIACEQISIKFTEICGTQSQVPLVS